MRRGRSGSQEALDRERKDIWRCCCLSVVRLRSAKRLSGQKGLETSVGGHPNSIAAEAAEQAKLDNERWSKFLSLSTLV